MKDNLGKSLPLVSVIIPVYNVEKYLSRCLDSILNQTCTDYEVICINDCSPDGCQSILEEYQKSNPEKLNVLVNEQNMGLGRTRERGIRHSRGEWLLFIDSDDYVRNDYIETYLKAMEQGDYDVIAGGYVRDVEGNLEEHKVTYDEWTIITYPIACAKLIRKRFLTDNRIEFSDIRCGEDIYFSLQVFYFGAKYRSIDYVGYYYYFNRNSITGSLTADRKHEEFVSHIFSAFLERHDICRLEKDRQRVIEYAYIANMINALITYGRGCGIKKMSEKYHFFMSDLKGKFPDYKSNPYYGMQKQKYQLPKVRIGVGVTMFLHKLRLDKLMFYMISMV